LLIQSHDRTRDARCLDCSDRFLVVSSTINAKTWIPACVGMTDGWVPGGVVGDISL